LAHRQSCAVLLCTLFGSLACAAPDAPPRYGLSIGVGLPLDEALQELARQTGIQLVFFSTITTGRSAPELSGEYTLAAAMTRLLEGSDLTFRQVNEHTIEVRQAALPSAGAAQGANGADARLRRSAAGSDRDRHGRAAGGDASSHAAAGDSAEYLGYFQRTDPRAVAHS